MLPFLKMNGLGNDFIIIDQRINNYQLSENQIRGLSHRKLGIGCDQFIILQTPRKNNHDIFMRIYNANGLEAGACGNAMRCVGLYESRKLGKKTILIETIEGSLSAEIHLDETVTVNMGEPYTNWEKIPLSYKPDDTFALNIHEGILSKPSAISMGNPHMVFFVEDVDGVDIATLGSRLTNHPAYPKGANVEVVQVLSETRLRMRVFERGTGITMACGTGAAASVVAACHHGYCKENSMVEVLLDGGILQVNYRAKPIGEGGVTLTGPATLVCEGAISQTFLDRYISPLGHHPLGIVI